jgi:hypothetical protein
LHRAKAGNVGAGAERVDLDGEHLIFVDNARLGVAIGIAIHGGARAELVDILAAVLIVIKDLGAVVEEGSDAGIVAIAIIVKRVEHDAETVPAILVAKHRLVGGIGVLRIHEPQHETLGTRATTTTDTKLELGIPAGAIQEAFGSRARRRGSRWRASDALTLEKSRCCRHSPKKANQFHELERRRVLVSG